MVKMKLDSKRRAAPTFQSTLVEHQEIVWIHLETHNGRNKTCKKRPFFFLVLDLKSLNFNPVHFSWLLLKSWRHQEKSALNFQSFFCWITTGKKGSHRTACDSGCINGPANFRTRTFTGQGFRQRNVIFMWVTFRVFTSGTFWLSFRPSWPLTFSRLM